MRLPPTSYTGDNNQRLARALLDASRADVVRVEYFAAHPDRFEAYTTGLARWIREGPDALEDALADVEEAWAAAGG